MSAKKTILIADDDSAIVEAMKLVLEDAGFLVKTASNEREIKGAVKLFSPDLIMLDIWMSGTDGCQVCTTLKQSPVSAHIPIIMVSASKDTAKKALDCGANDFLEKPFEISALVHKVKKYL